MNSTPFSPQINHAIETASRLHAGQFRKGQSHIPYIVRPLAVGMILGEINSTESVVIAGILHDTIEDTPYTIKELSEEFGEEVANIVQHVTLQLPEGTPYSKRYTPHLDNIRQGGPDAWSVALADKIHNLQSSIDGASQDGPAFWENFLGGMQPRIDFLEKLLQVARKDVPDHPLLSKFIEVHQKWLSIIPDDQR